MIQTKRILFTLFQIQLLFIHCAKLKKESSFDLSEHSMVTSNNVFPYVAAILRKSTYLVAGALIDDSWVLTAADSLFLVRDSLRFLSVRLGSTNYKKGGVVRPVKYFEIHPYFDDQKPEYDLALVRLADSVRFTPSLNPIRIQKMVREVTATHFIVTAWPTVQSKTKELHHLESMESIKRRRLLTVAHLHPTEQSKCSEHLDEIGVTGNNIMCLDPALGKDPCARDAGAPVVLNGILWGVVSSWKQEDCDLETAPSLVTLVAPTNISSWIHSNLHGKKWNKKRAVVDMLDYADVDYEEEYM